MIGFNHPALAHHRDMVKETNTKVGKLLEGNADRIAQQRHNQRMLADKMAVDAEERIATAKIDADKQDKEENRNLLVGLLKKSGIRV